MAFNMDDKKYLLKEILPEIDFNILSTGITISSKRLNTPRFLPFDQPGKCRECRSTEAEIDFVVAKEGVTVFCNRIKGSRFVQFDRINDLPGYCFFKIRNKGRVCQVPYGEKSAAYQPKPVIQYLSPPAAHSLLPPPEPFDVDDGNTLMEPPTSINPFIELPPKLEPEIVPIPMPRKRQQQNGMVSEIKKETEGEVEFVKEVKREIVEGKDEQQPVTTQHPLQSPPRVHSTPIKMIGTDMELPSDRFGSVDSDSSEVLNEFFDKLEAVTFGLK